MGTHPSSLRPALRRIALCAAAIGLWVSGAPAQERPALSPPDETRFTRRVLIEGMDEPMEVEFDRQGGVYWIERRGALRRLDEATGQVATLGTLAVDAEAESGLIGFLLDRDFEATRRLYLYYSAPDTTRREMRLSRFTLGADDRLDPASEIVMLRWGWEPASHMGGGMVWDRDGNLYLSTGDNSNATQYAPIRWTNPGGRSQDSQRSAANSNDYRGKILRIHPEPDGRYTIPAGNLFPPGTPGTLPEIYTMGNRNPWRLSIDSRTGYLHWGEIGPDAGRDSAGVGPMGYDEFNVARAAGNFGWPLFIGYNRAYNRYDNETDRYGEPFDPRRPVNSSPNNTGLRELPPAQPALIAYPYGVSEEYPILNSGGRMADGGPVFHRADFAPGAKRLFPDHYEGKWLVADFVRNWIMAVTLDPQSTRVLSVERFLPKERYSSVMDLDFGPDGDLYVLEYGTQWGEYNADARLSRIEYNAGNRAPKVTVDADRKAGATPLRVALSSRGTVDYDGDALRYEWVVTPEAGGAPQRFTTASPVVTLTRPGAYRAVLTVTDPSGASGSGEVRVVAGNEPPRVALEVTRGNRSFYFPGAEVEYRARVTDREDAARGIAPGDVKVTAEYVPAGMTPAEAADARELPPEASVRHVRALAILARSDCRVCHTVETRSAGPAFREVARKYRGDTGAAERLARKIITGGSGVWGQAVMPAHPALAPAEAATLAHYVLSLAETDAAPRPLPAQGSFTTAGHTRPGASPGAAPVPEAGAYVLRATYTDRGANGVPPLTAGDVVLLRYPKLAPEAADLISEGIALTDSRDPGFFVNRSGAHVGFRGIDLTGIGAVEVTGLTRFYTWSHFKGATVEARLDAPDGPRVGEPASIMPPTGPNAPSGPVFTAGPPARIELSGVSGVHDLYLVFRNPAAGPDDALLLLTAVEFRPTAAPAPRTP